MCINNGIDACDSGIEGAKHETMVKLRHFVD